MTTWAISMGVSPREPLAHVGEVAAEAERLGFEAAWFIDFQLGMKDVYVAMTMAAIATERIRIGPGVTNLSTRHPTVTANAIAALDEVSNGRALLGLGAGATAVMGAGLRSSRLADVRAGVQFLRALLAGEEARSNGLVALLASAPKRPVPIYLAVSRPGMLRLAGEIADGAILMGAADPAFCAWQLDRIGEGLSTSGRARRDIVIDLVVVLSADEDEDRAVADVRAWATSQASDFAHWPELPAGFDRFSDDFRRADESYRLIEHLSLHASHNVAVGAGFARTVAIAGNVEHCVARLRELAALDVDRITFALLSGGRIRRLEQLTQDILPLVGG